MKVFTLQLINKNYPAIPHVYDSFDKVFMSLEQYINGKKVQVSEGNGDKVFSKENVREQLANKGYVLIYGEGQYENIYSELSYIVTDTLIL